MTVTSEVKQVAPPALGSGDTGQCSAVVLKVLTVTGEEYGQDEFQRIDPLNSDVCLNSGSKIFQQSSHQLQIPIRHMDEMKQVPF